LGGVLIRIGDKIINKKKIHDAIDGMIVLRQQGYSQQEVANRLGIDRTVISRLETLGEVRKGGQIALVGFPISNRSELSEVAKEEGVDFVLLLTEEERWRFVDAKSGAELFNEVMRIVAQLRTYDTLIFIGSNMRIKLMEALLDKEVIGIQVGESPIAEDKYYDPTELRKIIQHLKAREA
jgi:transcriptional regulator with XRE-family HTH domain